MCGYMFSFFLDMYLGVVLLGHMVIQCLNFLSIWGNFHPLFVHIFFLPFFLSLFLWYFQMHTYK